MSIYCTKWKSRTKLVIRACQTRRLKLPVVHLDVALSPSLSWSSPTCAFECGRPLLLSEELWKHVRFPQESQLRWDGYQRCLQLARFANSLPHLGVLPLLPVSSSSPFPNLIQSCRLWKKITIRAECEYTGWEKLRLTVHSQVDSWFSPVFEISLIMREFRWFLARKRSNLGLYFSSFSTWALSRAQWLNISIKSFER